MTTKTTALPATPGDRFQELPPRDDMLNVIYLHEPGHIPACAGITVTLTLP